MNRLLVVPGVLTIGLALVAVACNRSSATSTIRATGYVEATEVRVSAQVSGRILELKVAEGDRVKTGDVLARLDTADSELSLKRSIADRDQADANLRLLKAGSRDEDIRQAQAQLQSAQNEAQVDAAQLESANADVKRFEDLLRANAGSVKQRDDAVTARDVAAAKLRAAQNQAQAAADLLAKLKAGSRPQEIEAGRARVASADVQIATSRKAITDAVVTSPVDGIVTSKLLDAGEMAAVHAPIVVVTDLDRAWANVYVDGLTLPQLRIGQSATILTDAGQRLNGTITFISPNAEFTPRNVQTPEERSKLVYRIKVTTDNREGILKPGMPVDAELPLACGTK
jgi:HlyD family secretion protein